MTTGTKLEHPFIAKTIDHLGRVKYWLVEYGYPEHSPPMYGARRWIKSRQHFAECKGYHTLIRQSWTVAIDITELPKKGA